ncbi:MAG: nicotinamide mononucleotide transporter family protein [Gammaproteobacteria bacterium]|nr:nicotinamide mononucleotide transporter family protein [Gammaproteobacteria bacterium]
MTALGICAIIATFINLWYCYHERIENFFWNWPAYGLVAVGMFINHAYANAAMQIIQAGVSTYGFFIWTRHRNHSLKQMLYSMVHDRHHRSYPNPVIATSRMPLKAHLFSLLAIIVMAAILYSILHRVNDIAPITDAVSFTFLLIASIQLNYKKIESWIYFIIGDLLSLLLAYKAHNWYNMIAVSLLIVLNIICFTRWLRSMRKRS